MADGHVPGIEGARRRRSVVPDARREKV